MALMVAMVALVTIGVFFRYIVNASLSWYDEFASYLLVWLSFYGAVVATYRGRHIGFETLAERRGPRARRLMAGGGGRERTRLNSRHPLKSFSRFCFKKKKKKKRPRHECNGL